MTDPLYIVTDRTEPTCGAHTDACDPLEHPSHWVDVRLSAEFIASLKMVLDELDARRDYSASGGDDDELDEAMANLRDAIERGQKPG